MISNTTDSFAPKIGKLRQWPRSGADRLLSLAAAPIFAIMALLTGVLGGGHGSDVPLDERLPFAALVEADLQMAKRNLAVLIRKKIIPARVVVCPSQSSYAKNSKIGDL
jgi:hypothetical protein